MPLFEQPCCNGVTIPEKVGANPTVSAGNGTGPDDDERMQLDSLKKGKGEGATANTKTKKAIARATRAKKLSTRATTVTECDIV